MNTSLTLALDVVRRNEGGYVDDPHDPGGCTNHGITLATYRLYVRRDASCEDIRLMTWEEAASIYERAYWAKVWADRLPAGVDLSVFDMAVNAGPGQAVKLLQRALLVAVDGLIGPNTLAAANGAKPAVLIDAYARKRLAFYQSLSGWGRYGRGWARRTEEVRQAAKTLAGAC